MNTVIAVDKELYEAVLRNSVRVNDLEAENHKLKEINLWHSEKSWNCERKNQQLKELLYSLKCCLTSENIEPQIRIDKSLGKIDEVLK